VSRSGLTLLLSAAAAATGCATAASSGRADASRPSVNLVALAPVIVRGAGFKSHERVTVSVLAGRRRRKTITANAAGRFQLAFTTLRLDACAGISISALGNRGSRVDYRLSPGLCPRP
jgi:hypothetical protein